MSYLSVPQINFKGTAYCNPSTGDNNDFANIFDVDTLAFAPTMTVIDPTNNGGLQAQVVDPPGEQSFTYTGVDSASGCREWLMGLMTNVADGGPDGQQAHWNYYGDHATRLDKTAVTTAVSPSGRVYPTTDPIYQASVSLIGTPSFLQFQDPVIVDNDPYALITSQIFSYGIKVVGPSPENTPLITANPTSRAYAYYINVQKNLDPTTTGFQMVSAIFVVSVPKSPNLVINTSAGSQALVDLAAAVEKGAGLQMRFIFYNALYDILPDDLHAKFKQGLWIANPYMGTTLGTIGVLGQGELLSAPPGRKLNLQTPIPYNLVGTQCGTSTDPKQNSGNVLLGITLAEVDTSAQTIYLDCISTFPECSKKTQSKYPFGQMALYLQPPNGSAIFLANIPNDTTTYENTAGLVAISYANNPQVQEIEAALDTGSLAIYLTPVGGTPQPVLVESSGLDIQTEDRAIYFDYKTVTNWFDPNEQPVAGTGTVTINAFQKTVPVQQATPVILEYWMCAKDQVNPSKPQIPVPQKYFTVSGAIPLPPLEYQNPQYNPNLPPGPNNPKTCWVLRDQVTIPANSNGQLMLTLTAARPGTSLIRFVDPAMPQTQPNFCWDDTDYCCIRILPFDDYRSVPDSTVNNWPYMYANFFNYFALLYPVMSKVIPWGPLDAPQNPVQVADFAAQIKMLTDPSIWNQTNYMPVTRDLSGGKRALLWRWCALQRA